MGEEAAMRYRCPLVVNGEHSTWTDRLMASLVKPHVEKRRSYGSSN